MKRKKLLTLSVLLLFVLSVFSVSMTGVSAVDSPCIKVVPESTVTTDLTVGMLYTVSIYTDYAGWDVTGYEFTLYYNPGVLEGINVTNGDLIVGGSAKFIAGPIDNTAGKLFLTVAYYDAEGAVTTGPGTLANVTFTVVGEGASTITLGPETRLYGWNFFEWEEKIIIDAATMPTHIQHGYFQNVVDLIHDIAVISVTPSSTSVLVGSSVDITVVVENQGNIDEAFNVTAYANDTAIETKTVTNLGSGLTKSLTFGWNTTDWELGNYAIKAVAETVSGEIDTSDNTKEDGEVAVSMPVWPPIAIITYEETSAYPNETMIFNGGESYDPDGGTIIAYYWDFGDGTNATGQTAIHEYKTIGFYELTLVVTDSQDQVGWTTLPIKIDELPPVPPAYAADLVRWKVKPEAHSWDYSKDIDKKVTLTALASNFGTNAVNVTITFDIIDWKKGISAGDPILADVTLAVGETVPVDVLLDPYDYTYTGSKLVLQVDVTLKYDSDGDGTPDTDASSKIIHFSIVP